MKKSRIVFASIVVALLATYAGLFFMFSAPANAFEHWHKSLADGKEYSKKNQLPMLVKIGSEF